MPEKIKIIDAHTHFGTDFFNTKIRRYPLKETAKRLIKKMKKYGIDKSIVFPTAAASSLVCPNIRCAVINKLPKLVEKNDKSFTLQCPVCKTKFKIKKDPYKSKNKNLLSICKKYKDNLIPFVTIDPRYPSAAKELCNLIKNENIYGIKIHPLVVNYAAQNLIDTEIMDMVKENSIPMIFHSGREPECSPLNVIKLAKHYPKVNFIIAHCARLHKIALKKIDKLKNIYVENSLLTRYSNNSSKIFFEHLSDKDKELIKTPLGIYKYLISLIGSDKLLFGTDIPYVKIEEYEEQIESLRNLKLKDKERICHKNIERLLK